MTANIEKQAKKVVDLMETNDALNIAIMTRICDKGWPSWYKTCRVRLTDSCLKTSRAENYIGNGNWCCRPCYNYSRIIKRETIRQEKELALLKKADEDLLKKEQREKKKLEKKLEKKEPLKKEPLKKEPLKKKKKD